MAETAISSTPTPTQVPPPLRAQPAQAELGAWDLVKKVLTPLASLRLTIVLFVLSFALVFLGTLAQVDAGIWTVVNTYFRWWWVWIPFQVFVKFGQVFFGLPTTWSLPGSFLFPGGWTLGFLLLVNLLAAHTVRFRATWKRAGVLVLHAGLVVMMIGEFIAAFQSEGNMTIDEGSSSNFVEDTRSCELAFVSTDGKMDDVVAIPQALLRRGGVLHHDALPVDVEVLRYMPNSHLEPMKKVEPGNPATAGVGLEFTAVEDKEGAGAAAQQKVDLQSAYVTLRDKESGKPLATYLVSLWLRLQPPQPVKIGDKNYDLALRWKRTYKPYSVHLIKFRFDRYEGTTTAKNFSSLVRLTDKEWGVDREVLIRMNEPLRHRGETLYQSSFDDETLKTTVLQVVKNPGWLLPYISCALVAVGMIVHFSLTLVEFLRRKLFGTAAAQATVKPDPLSFYIPLAVVCVAVLYLIVVMLPPSEGPDQPHLSDLAAVPVLDHGRVKPFDALARNSLKSLSGYEEYYDIHGNQQPAVKWLLEVMTGTGKEGSASEERKAFRIEDPETRALLGLADRTGSEQPLYAFKEFEAKADKLFDEAKRLMNVPQTQWTDRERRLMDLAMQVMTYEENRAFETPYKVFKVENDQLLGLLELKPRSGLRYGFDEIVPRIGPLMREAGRAGKLDEKSLTAYEVKLMELARRVQLYVGLAQFQAETVHLVPPLHPGDEWRTFPQAVHDVQAGHKDPIVTALTLVLHTYMKGDIQGFNHSVAAYRRLVDDRLPSESEMAGVEVFFNHFAPFYQCTVLYVIVLLLVFVSWAAYTEPLRRAALWLAVLTLVVHTLALGARMWIQGRPPVTNLYSSAVFIGWGCLVLALFLEWILRNGIGLIVAGVAGFVTTMFAHYLAGSGDTLEMMQAVLDTNFWLATHVVCVTLGYMATIVAGLLGLVYVGLQVVSYVTKQPTKDSELRTLGQVTYGVVCFATLLSFVGTVLGGIWADQSWGRFWGWDPKENGALLIVIWNALILHARWAGIVKQRGIALMTIAGMMVVGWSWVGTNQLGVGLHAYGFNNTLATGLAVFWCLASALLVVGGLPWARWARAAARS
jgi:ABC-type transport system involved in cytochrome c biogenesis permease subunit